MTRQEYKDAVEKDWRDLTPEQRALFTPSKSQITERIMRLGREVRAWDLVESDFEDVALMTLKNDFVRRQKGL